MANLRAKLAAATMVGSLLAAPAEAEVSRVWFGFNVAAISSTSTDPVQFSTLLSGSPTSARIDIPAVGSVALSPIGGGVWQATLTAAQVLNGYTPADVNHNFVGYLRCFEGATQSAQYNVFINVVDENVPSVVPTPVHANLRRACRVVNYWDPSLTYPPSDATMRQIAQAFYASFGDDYDFVNLLFTLPSYHSNRYHITVKNQVSGLGMAIHDASAQWGSAGRLLGVQVFPIDTFFDLGETAAVHEIGHQWINYCSYAPLAIGVPHWPAGTQARGVMGVSLAGGEGGDFPYALELQPNGDYRMVGAPPLREFTDLDLYLMGLVPPGQVGANFVFSDPNQPTCGGCEGPVTHFTVADVIAAQGARVPAWPGTPRGFRVATIIATRDRLLGGDEMAAFEYFAARGEARTTLPFTAGLASGTTKPFYVATGGRGTLETALRPICAELVGVADAPLPARQWLRLVGPQPVREEAVLEWDQERTARAFIDLYSVDGRHLGRVAGGTFAAGSHRATWSVPRREGGPAPGVYFARLRLDGADAGALRLVVVR